MKRISLILLSLVFLGAGCSGLGFGTKVSRVPDGGIFKTSDAGDTWVQTNAVPTAQGMGTLSTTNILHMEVDPQDSAFLYLGTRANGLVYSDDRATSWRIPRYIPFQNGSIRSVEVDPMDMCTVYVAKESRLYKTENCLRSFSDETYVETRLGVEIVQIALDWYRRGTVFIGLSNGDVLKSTDAGKSWQTILKTGEDISEILLSNNDSRKILVTMYQGGIQRTTDGGDTWEEIEGNIDALSGADQVYALTQTTDSSVLLASTGYGLLRSNDFGLTWQPLQLLTAPGEVFIRAAGIAPADPNLIYYATPLAFYQTVDGGQTWRTKKFPSARVPRTLLIDPKDSQVLYIGVAEELK